MAIISDDAGISDASDDDTPNRGQMSLVEHLTGVGGNDLSPNFTASKYLSFIMLMFVAFGVAFEFAILLVALELAGVLTSQRLRKWRRPAIVVITFIAAVITPSQDPYSLFFM